MKKIALAIHGGAGPDSEYIKKNIEGYQKGLASAIEEGYAILEKGGTAIEAVEASIRILEDNPHFNAGKGSALTEKGEAEMCASIMDGKNQNAGAAAIVKGVRNPIRLARAIMEKSRYTYLGDSGALEFAKIMKLPMEPMAYFITEHQFEEYESAKKEQHGDAIGTAKEKLSQDKEKKHGTVGAVALDADGNIAAGTSTGGLEFCKMGRIADSSMIGVGTYANNHTCAVSTTGEGEFHIRHVTAFHIAALMEYKGMSLREASYFLIHEKCKDVKADMGLIGVDVDGNLVAEFNTERMHRALRSSTQDLIIKIYP
jgi:beta-aspartyl-peptidase (threonine type)